MCNQISKCDYTFPRISIQNLQTSQGCIFHILQYFATKLHYFTKFRMLFPAVLFKSIFLIQKFVQKENGHRYLMYSKWCIPHRGQAKIEARSQALVVPTELTRSMIICVFCIAEIDKVDNKSCFMQLKVFNTQMQKSIVFSLAFF